MEQDLKDLHLKAILWAKGLDPTKIPADMHPAVASVFDGLAGILPYQQWLENYAVMCGVDGESESEQAPSTDREVECRDGSILQVPDSRTLTEEEIAEHNENALVMMDAMGVDDIVSKD